MNNTSKYGFTLAETLITLGIIGIVAAMTIPNLITAHQKKVAGAKLKRAVSVINQAIKLSEVENGEMENWDKNLKPEDFIDKYFRPYIKITQICPNVKNCGYKPTYCPTCFWAPLSLKGDPGYLNPNAMGRVPFITMDKILYDFGFLNKDIASTLDNDKMIIIDINGSDKPNTFGKDVFFFYRIEEEDSVIPWGADKSSDEIQKSCSKNDTGFYCAAWIRNHGWTIPNGYPW